MAIVLVLAGFLFTTSAHTARGTQLRSEQADLADLVRREQREYAERERRAAVVEAEVRRRTEEAAAGSAAVRQLQERAGALAGPAGLEPVRGPGLTVALDDAPRDSAVPADALPDDLVVHQQDVQAVVNALWAGGAEAMTLQDQRVISTSAVRCVGNTLILQGRVYSPPYTVTAVGDVAGMRRALDASPEVALYREYVRAVRLGWDVRERAEVLLPAFEGSPGLRYARVPGSPGSPAATTAAATTDTPTTDTAATP